jgi:hypothetical protein
MKVFLDIDGVMVHANPHKPIELEDDGFYRFAYKAICAINSIDNAEIILSTSHRHRFSVNIWSDMFERRGIHFNSISIIETQCSHKISRREEIEKWIKIKHYKLSEFIIIDDDKSLNDLPKKIKDRVVLTSPYKGLDDDNEIKKILEKGAI